MTCVSVSPNVSPNVLPSVLPISAFPTNLHQSAPPLPLNAPLLSSNPQPFSKNGKHSTTKFYCSSAQLHVTQNWLQTFENEPRKLLSCSIDTSAMSIQICNGQVSISTPLLHASLYPHFQLSTITHSIATHQTSNALCIQEIGESNVRCILRNVCHFPPPHFSPHLGRRNPQICYSRGGSKQ